MGWLLKYDRETLGPLNFLLRLSTVGPSLGEEGSSWPCSHNFNTTTATARNVKRGSSLDGAGRTVAARGGIGGRSVCHKTRIMRALEITSTRWTIRLWHSRCSPTLLCTCIFLPFAFNFTSFSISWANNVWQYCFSMHACTHNNSLSLTVCIQNLLATLSLNWSWDTAWTSRILITKYGPLGRA